MNTGIKLSNAAGRVFLVLGILALMLSGPVFAQDYNYQKLPMDDLTRLVAPIALYPDDLLINVLTASSNPLDVVQAARSLRNNEGRFYAVPDNDWDPGLQSLQRFPGVLYMMDQKLDWTEGLGAAFFYQQGDVMSAIQACRRNALVSGLLVSNSRQRVGFDGQVVTITSTDPSMIYVPTYSPEILYSRPAVYSSTLGTLITFAAGVIVGNWFRPWSADWHHRTIIVRNDYFRNYYPRYYRDYYHSRRYDNHPGWIPNGRTTGYHNSRPHDYSPYNNWVQHNRPTTSQNNPPAVIQHDTPAPVQHYSPPTAVQHNNPAPIPHNKPNPAQHNAPPTVVPQNTAFPSQHYTPTTVVQHNTPTPAQHSNPAPVQHNTPAPVPQHSNPTPVQHNTSNPAWHTAPTPVQHITPTPARHSKPSTVVQHGNPAPVKHSAPSVNRPAPKPSPSDRTVGNKDKGSNSKAEGKQSPNSNSQGKKKDKK